MITLYLHAPFAACRTFTAGWYRPTAGFLTPSAAYGLLLNVARIESRLWEHDSEHNGKTPASLMRSGLPRGLIALGIPEGMYPPTVQSIYQQLHNYPVGKDAGISRELAKGNKNNITPVRRELLADLHAVICLGNNEQLETRIRDGLAGKLNDGRYGLPFLGDNQFLLNRLEERTNRPKARWYERVEREAGKGPRSHTTRLTTWIDRADMSKTRSTLYAPSEDATSTIPETAWTEINPQR